MAGLGPAIHEFILMRRKLVDARTKCGHDVVCIRRFPQHPRLLPPKLDSLYDGCSVSTNCQLGSRDDVSRAKVQTSMMLST